MQVAKTILEQLGGNRFAMMTGAKNFVGSADSLSFKLPSNFAKSGINFVRVTLDPSDTYTVKFLKIRGAKVTEIETREMVYCDTLQSTFKAVTGLDTHL
jgi:hypothetical protein